MHQNCKQKIIIVTTILPISLYKFIYFQSGTFCHSLLHLLLCFNLNSRNLLHASSIHSVGNSLKMKSWTVSSTINSRTIRWFFIRNIFNLSFKRVTLLWHDMNERGGLSLSPQSSASYNEFVIFLAQS